MIRRLLTLASAVSLTLAISGTALAGGWAITVINEAPTEFEPGATYQVTYTILQHGRTPVSGAATSIDFNHPTLKEVISFPGVETKTPGQYLAEVSLPTSGTWGWEVNQGGFGYYELGTVTVVANSQAAVTGPSSGILQYLLLAATLAAAVMFGAQVRSTMRPLAAGSPQRAV